MQLYFSPLACSLATRIALYEVGVDIDYVEVDPKTKRTRVTGDDYLAIHPLGLVPALRTDDGGLLFENAAVLAYVAERFPEAGLVPEGADGPLRLREALAFIATELHKGTFAPLLDAQAPPEMKAYVAEKAGSRLAWVERKLEGRVHLFERPSVADAYLFTVLNWAQATPVSLARYPAIGAFMARMRARPAVARALREELELYRRAHA